MKEVVFDTNAYRGVAEILKYKSEEEKKAFIERFLACEKDKGYNHVFNPFVILELLKHLVDRNDNAYFVCKEAILFVGEYTLKGALLPLLDDYLARMLFGFIPENSVGVERMNDLPFVVEKIKQNGGSDLVIDNLKPQLATLTDLLNDYKQMLIDNFKVTSESFTSVENPWVISKKRDKVKNLNKNNDQFYLVQAEITLKRITDYLGIDYESMNDVEKQDKIKLLSANFQFPFRLFMYFNQSMMNNGYNLDTSENKNDFIDTMIAFSINKVNNYLLVTNEKRAIKKAVKELSLENQVFSLDEYLKKIGFIPPQ